MTRPITPVVETNQKFIGALFVHTLQQITGLPAGRVIIETKADRRPPEGLYCTVWFKELEPLVQNEGDFEYPLDSYDNDEPATQILDNESHCVVQIEMWGDDAYARAIDAMQALQNSQRFEDLWRVIGFAGIDYVRDISVQYGAKIQQRAYFNLSYYVCLGKKYPADWFKDTQWVLSLAALDYNENWDFSKEAADEPDPRCMS